MQNEDKDKKEKSAEVETPKNKKINIIRIVAYAIFIIVSLVVYKDNLKITATLGDFNNLFSVLMNLILVITLKWLPILSLFGIILEILVIKIEEGLKEFSLNYFIIVIILFIVSVVGIFSL